MNFTERSRLGAVVYAGAQFGTIISMPLSGLLAEYSWPSIFYVFGAVGVIWVSIWIRHSKSMKIFITNYFLQSIFFLWTVYEGMYELFSYQATLKLMSHMTKARDFFQPFSNHQSLNFNANDSLNYHTIPLQILNQIRKLMIKKKPLL